MSGALPCLTVTTRRQLSMYVPAPDGVQLELVRRALDPVQAALIPAHVTLCRDDEMDRLSAVDIEAGLESSGSIPLTLSFGPPVTFEGHGVLLPCVAGEDDFHRLRAHVLGTAGIRRLIPHITLAHPRNPPAASGRLAGAMGLPASLSYTFSIVGLIEQVGASPWRLLREFGLASQPDRTG